MRRSVLAHRLAPLSISALLVLSACIAPYLPDPDNTITLLSQPSIVLSQQGDQATIRAEIRRPDGSTDERAVLTLTSSDPNSVTVASDGTLTAQSDLGSAVITLGSEALMPVAVTVIVAQVNDWTQFIDDEDVLSATTDQSEIVLVRNAATRDLEGGDVIVSGSLGGVFARILNVARQDDTMVIDGRLALLPEAFAQLDLDLAGPSTPIVVSAEDDIVSVRNQGGQLVHQAILDGIGCEAETGAVGVSFSGLSFDANLDRLRPTIRYSETADLSNPGVCALFPLECVVVEEFTLAIDAQASATATFGQLSVSGGIDASVECKLELPTIPIVPVPLLGPLSIAGSVTPNITVTVNGSYSGASLTIRGPELAKSVAFEAGFSYIAGSSYQTVGSGEPTFSGPGLTWDDASADIHNELTLSIEPAFNVTPGVSLLIGGDPLLSFDLLNISLLGGAEVTFGLPLELVDSDYLGPRWQIYFGGSADLNALLDNLQAVEKLLEFVGLEGVDDLVALDLKLFEIKTTVARGPEPTVSAERDGTSRSVDLSATTDGGLDNGSSVVFYAAEELDGGDFGTLEEVASANVQGGTASTAWEAPSGGAQRYRVSARVESIFGDALPYGPEQNAEIDLSGGIVLDPESLTVGLDVGETRDETVTLVSQGLAANYEVVNGQPHVTIANPQGSIEVDGTVDLDLNVTCPSLAGSYPQTFDLLFRDRDDQVIEESVPKVLPVELICSDDPPGFALIWQARTAIAATERQGTSVHSGEAYNSDDSAGTGSYTVTDLVDGVDNSTTTEVGPLGFGTVDVTAAASAICAVDSDRNSSVSAASSSSLSVLGSVVTFTGDLTTSLSTSSRFQCQNTASLLGDGSNTVVAIDFELSTGANLIGSWTCDGSFDRGTVQGSGNPRLRNHTEQIWIFDGTEDPCEVDLDIPAGFYMFRVALHDSVRYTDPPLEGVSRTKNGSYTFTLTLTD